MFTNRVQAGRLLGEKLETELGKAENRIVLGIPRGGVVTAGTIAQILKCPLDVIITKKVNPPDRPELALGAVGETEGSEYLNQSIIRELKINSDYLKREIARKKGEIKRREEIFRAGRPPVSLENKEVIVVDDGAATGATMIAALREVWNNQPKKVIAALPVLAQDTLNKLETEADEVIYLQVPKLFFAVGQFYKNFPQVSDEKVREILGGVF